MLKHITPLLLVLVLLSTSSSCTKKTSSGDNSKSTESIVVKAPKDWKMMDKVDPKGSTLVQLIPKNQDLKNWQDTLVIKSYPTNSVIDPQKQLELTKEGFQKACNYYKASNISNSVENYYRIANLEILCGQFKNKNYGEYLRFKSIQGQDSFFVVYRSWKLSKKRGLQSIQKSEIGEWDNILKSMKLCDDINPKLSCPKTNPKFKKLAKFIFN